MSSQGGGRRRSKQIWAEGEKARLAEGGSRCGGARQERSGQQGANDNGSGSGSSCMRR
ncbi:UNVERIFIED_CONTAM: hypothetical protein Sradi_7026400 [Sesamum radiatum]|uniref:Uncharacterized protein n=1 Tax=Sesamum radiatum TaxID=300843 RepID=A0AAW2JD08_SESRA